MKGLACGLLALSAGLLPPDANAEEARKTVFILDASSQAASGLWNIRPLLLVSGNKLLPPPRREVPHRGTRYGVFLDGVRIATAAVIEPGGDGVMARVAIEGNPLPGKRTLAADFDPGPQTAVRRATTPEELNALARLTQLILGTKGAPDSTLTKVAPALASGPESTGLNRGEVVSLEPGRDRRSVHVISLDLRDKDDVGCWLANIIVEREGKVYEPTLRDSAIRSILKCRHEPALFFLTFFDFDGDGKNEMVFDDGALTVVYRLEGWAWREVFRDQARSPR